MVDYQPAWIPGLRFALLTDLWLRLSAFCPFLGLLIWSLLIGSLLRWPFPMVILHTILIVWCQKHERGLVTFQKRMIENLDLLRNGRPQYYSISMSCKVVNIVKSGLFWTMTQSTCSAYYCTKVKCLSHTSLCHIQHHIPVDHLINRISMTWSLYWFITNSNAFKVVSSRYKTSPQAKRHKPSLLFTSLTILFFINIQLSSQDNFHH